MTDRNKVIRGLECCKWSDAGRYDGYEPMYENCEKCPYNNEQDSKSECNDKLRQDALFLLKEQEPVNPIVEQYALPLTNTSVRFIKKHHCGICKEELTGNNVYCHKCGRKVKWN